jgi:hypothetical protein
MLLILPVAAILLFFLILREKGIEWRRAALAAAVFCGTCVVVITETLSLPRLLTRSNVALFWLAICVGCFLYLRNLRKHTARPAQSSIPSSDALDPATKGLLVAAGVIAIFVGITALVMPPSMWDAMEYHLGRVAMWMSNYSVRFFATPDYAQLIFGPWAEYSMMHVHLLWGGDRFVNFVEFFSMLGSALGVSYIAKLIGAGPRGQALAAVACATIPEAVLEASGPMNTYVVSFWIMTTVAFLLAANEDSSWLNTICAGLAAGLALLTKGTAYVYLPFIVLACWLMGSASARMRFLQRCAVLVLLIVAVNGPHYFRSYDLTGSPLGLPFRDAGPGLHWMVDRLSFKGTAANILRNISLHLSTPSSAVNDRVERVLRSGIRGIGVDPDDPAMVWPNDTFRLNHFSLSEIHAGNPLHFALLLVSLALLLLARNQRARLKPLLYALGLIAAFVFFCSLLRWQVWTSRHHLPLFVLGSALIGLALERFFSKMAGTVIAILLLLYALPFALSNRERSLIPWSMVDDVYHPRSVLYFSDQHQMIALANLAAAEAINQGDCRDIAIDSYTTQPSSEINHSPRSFYVYPLFALIHADGRARTVWYSGVHNWSARYAGQEHHPAPCAVICLECANVPEKWAEYRDVGGRASVFDYIVVFSSSGQVLNSQPGMGLAQSDAVDTVQSGDHAR